MIIYLFRSLSYSLSLALSMYVTGELFRQSVRFFDETAMTSEFGIARMRLICIGIGACIGIEKAFDRVSLLRSTGLAFVLSWLSTNICYELEIAPPKVNLQAAWTGLITGGLNVFGSSLINQQVVDWNFLLIFFVSLWISELIYTRADNTDAIGLKKAAIMIFSLLVAVAALPAGYLMYDAIKHAGEFDVVEGTVELTFSASMTLRNLVLPSIVLSIGLAALYKGVQRWSYQGNYWLDRIIRFITGAPSPAQEEARRGAKESVDSSKVERGEIVPPPQH